MSDTNYKSYCGVDKVAITQETWVPPDNASHYDDVLKLSNCTRVVIDRLVLRGGKPRENWIDAVRGGAVVVSNSSIGSAGVSGITLKGALSGWALKGCAFDACAKREVEVGQFDDYWTPGRPPTTGGVITGCWRTDGKAIRVTCWDADVPQCDGDVSVRKVPKLIWFPYFLFRFCWIRIVGLLKGK